MGAAAAAPGPYAAVCAGELRFDRIGRVASPALDEISGVAASRRQAGVLWAVNDSGDAPSVYALSRSGRLLQTVALRAADAVDWEDIAAGPGPRRGTRYLYVADIGDNSEVRDEVAVYRFPEPAPGAKTARAEQVRLRYPDGPHDAEALLVDPVTGRLVIVTKRLGAAGVYAGPPRAAAEHLVSLRRVGSVDAFLGPVTGGSVSPHGDSVALRTVLGLALWRRPTGTPLWTAFRGRACTAAVPGERQGEAVTFSASGAALLTISEGLRPAVNEIRAYG